MKKENEFSYFFGHNIISNCLSKAIRNNIGQKKHQSVNKNVQRKSFKLFLYMILFYRILKYIKILFKKYELSIKTSKAKLFKILGILILRICNLIISKTLFCCNFLTFLYRKIIISLYKIFKSYFYDEFQNAM